MHLCNDILGIIAEYLPKESFRTGTAICRIMRKVLHKPEILSRYLQYKSTSDKLGYHLPNGKLHGLVFELESRGRRAKKFAARDWQKSSIFAAYDRIRVFDYYNGRRIRGFYAQSYDGYSQAKFWPVDIRCGEDEYIQIKSLLIYRYRHPKLIPLLNYEKIRDIIRQFMITIDLLPSSDVEYWHNL